MCKRIMQKRKWLAERAKPYPDKSMKDVPVPPQFPVPQCVCEIPAKIIQSTHPATAARAYYTCGHHLISVSFTHKDF